MTYLQRPANPDAVWEIALPNGRYLVRVVSGDPAFFDGVFRTTVEGVLTVNGSLALQRRALGRRDIGRDGERRAAHVRSGSGAVNNKLCFVKIWPQ